MSILDEISEEHVYRDNAPILSVNTAVRQEIEVSPNVRQNPIMHTTTEILKNRLIVSCQAPPNSPLNAPDVIAGMAWVCANQGVRAVRIDGPEQIRAVRDILPDTVIVGLWKRTLPDSAVQITPRLEDAIAILNAGADAVALDATMRRRPGEETVASIIEGINEYTGRPVIADIDSSENAVRASQAGADILNTTLYGYTEATSHLSPPGFDLLSELLSDINLPVICEGGIRTPEMMRRAFALGAHSVVVGTAITGMDRLAARYVECEPY